MDYLHMAMNNAWANETLYASVSELPLAEFTAPRPGFFPSLSRTLNHIYEVDLYYIDALEAGGLGRSVFRRDDIEDAGMLASLQAEADKTLVSFCTDVSSESLAELRPTERKNETTAEFVRALLLYLFQHQIHHRGQAHVQIQEAGIPPPQLDDFYLDFGRVPSAEKYMEKLRSGQWM